MSTDKRLNAWAWQKERREILSMAKRLMDGEDLSKQEFEVVKQFVNGELKYTEGAIEALEEAIARGETA